MNEQPSKIYLLPNLMTAGNLFCGFTATLKILEGALLQSANADLAADRFHEAIWFILGAFVFDFLDGRLARLGGHDTVFGREFDSLADIVSFGLAPALMVYRVVLNEFPNACWIIAFVYLACGALRLARFNSAAAAHNGPNHQNTFTGFPIPAAAGLIASITLFLLWLAEGEHHLGNWRFVLPPLLLFLSFMMFSRFQYPSFKNEEIDSAFPCYHPCSHFHPVELRVDAGGLVPGVLALRSSTAMAFTRMAARNRRRDRRRTAGRGG